MRRIILNTTMSRNGGGLLWELLDGHSDLYFSPAAIDIAIAKPRLWPFYSFNTVEVDDFFDLLSQKTCMDIGNSWKDMIHTPLHKIAGFDCANLKKRFLERQDNASKISVNKNNFALFFTKYLEDFFLECAQNVEQFECASNVLLESDHSFNCPVNSFLEKIPNMYFIQSIRDVRDVVASRKNMLLFHIQYYGDPKNKTLKPEVIRGEIARWLWSVVCAKKNRDIAGRQYILVHFESLKSNKREVLEDLCKVLDIAPEAKLLEKNKGMNDRSSLAHVTQGQKSSVIGSHKQTLNKDEILIVERCLNDLSYKWPREICMRDFGGYVNDFVCNSMNTLANYPHVSSWMQLSDSALVMEEYSKLNFGRANAESAFYGLGVEG